MPGLNPKNFGVATIGGKCDGCNGTGIRPGSPPHSGIPIPPGWVCVERCDLCCRYESDLLAATAYGQHAHDRVTRRSADTICKPTWLQKQLRRRRR